MSSKTITVFPTFVGTIWPSPQTAATRTVAGQTEAVAVAAGLVAALESVTTKLSSTARQVLMRTRLHRTAVF